MNNYYCVNYKLDHSTEIKTRGLRTFLTDMIPFPM